MYSLIACMLQQNGGKFDFIIEPKTISLPNDPQLWDYLFSAAVTEEWNLIVYEQDWLFVESDNLPALQVCNVSYITVCAHGVHQLE